MLATIMASSLIHESDGYINKERDPCASPPCKRLKATAPQMECVLVEDSDDTHETVVTDEKLGNTGHQLNENTYTKNSTEINGRSSQRGGDVNMDSEKSIPRLNDSVEDKMTNDSSVEYLSTEKSTVCTFFQVSKSEFKETDMHCKTTSVATTLSQNNIQPLQSDTVKIPLKCTENMFSSVTTLKTQDIGPSVSVSIGTPKATVTPKKKNSACKLSAEEKLRRAKERLQKQTEKEARQKERTEAKLKKEQERAEQLELKKQRLKEKNDKKEQEEREKKERMDRKEEEKRKKEENRRKKEIERNSIIEEKKRREEEEMMRKRKAKASFTSFFIKKEAKSTQKAKHHLNNEAKFQPFELKPYMELAITPYRSCMTAAEKEQFLEYISTEQRTSLSIVKKELNNLKLCACKHIAEKKDMLKDIIDVDIMIVDDIPPVESRTDEPRRKCDRIKVKLLQFCENNRPAYFGSWRKKSSSIRPRRPFHKDEDILNYEVDSDDEWEEEEPGESLSNSEGEDEDDCGTNEDEEEQDGFFVPHGYLSDGEGGDDDEIMEHDVNCSKNDKMERHLAKQKAWEAELKRQFKPMKPIVVGCLWEGDIPDVLRKLEACCLISPDFIDPITKEHNEPIGTVSPNMASVTYNNTVMPVPEEAMSLLIKILHGSDAGLKKLVQEFRKRWTLSSLKANSEISDENWESHCVISKRQAERKINTIAIKEVRQPIHRPCWYVHSSILENYNIDLPTSGI